jgi:hypothetical protein
MMHSIAKTGSIRELCEKLDVSDIAAGKLVMKGIVIRVCRGRYDLDLSLKNYIRHLREIAAGRGTSEESGLNLPDESARLKAAQRKSLVLKIALFKGEVRARVISAVSANRFSADQSKTNFFAGCFQRFPDVADRGAAIAPCGRPRKPPRPMSGRYRPAGQSD